MRTHGATRLLALILSLRYVARIQTSLNSCDRSERQNSVAATIIFTCHTRRFVAATCRGDVSQRFVASCVSALELAPSRVLRNQFAPFSSPEAAILLVSTENHDLWRHLWPGARFSKAPETSRARKAIFRSPECKNGEAYTPETSCMK